MHKELDKLNEVIKKKHEAVKDLLESTQVPFDNTVMKYYISSAPEIIFEELSIREVNDVEFVKKSYSGSFFVMVKKKLFNGK